MDSSILLTHILNIKKFHDLISLHFPPLRSKKIYYLINIDNNGFDISSPPISKWIKIVSFNSITISSSHSISIIDPISISVISISIIKLLQNIIILWIDSDMITTMDIHEIIDIKILLIIFIINIRIRLSRKLRNLENR
jgi:hypothetical protein